MKNQLLFLLIGIASLFSCQPEKVKIQIIETTDIHGRFFNYDFSTDTLKHGSMAQVANYVKQQRKINDAVILLDNGDMIQGTPTAYYSNYVDTLHQHIMTRVLSYLNYDAATVGNHDIEAGPAVYNKLKNELPFPWLGANILDKNIQEPAFPPYVIINKKGIKIAILGITTPGIPNWLPEKLYEGLEFGDMVETAEKWMSEIKKQGPDIIIGLFHAGLNPNYGGFVKDQYKNPNATLAVAREIAGFDLIFAGHDHKRTIKKVVNVTGDTVTIINGGSHGKWLGSAEIVYNNTKQKIESFDPQIIDLTNYPPDQEYLQEHTPYLDSVKTYFNEPIGWLGTKLCPQEALFGPSAFMQFIHEVQLSATNADVSLSAPLQIYHCIDSGTIARSDIFSLYRYENYLAELDMTFAELDGFLEHAVSGWYNTMNNSTDKLLNYNNEGKLEKPYYNFSSAKGIRYFVDVSKIPGDRVEIDKIEDQKVINPNDTIRVAINSYRMVGGGGHMPKGAGIDLNELSKRNVKLSKIPIKNIMIDYFEKNDSVIVNQNINWELKPIKWTKAAKQKEIRNF